MSLKLKKLHCKNFRASM